MNRTIVILAAHPDDEVLGVGGTIAHHAAIGDRVHVVIAAEGVTSRDVVRDVQLRQGDLADLQSATRNAVEILGGVSARFLGFPDNRCDSIDRLDLTKAIEEVIDDLQPQSIYVHHSGDVNIDHRRLHEAAFTACRPQPNHPVRRLLSFETVSSTEWAPPGGLPAFQPSVFVNINEYWPQKLAALEVYRREMREWPHARSIASVEHLGRWRGATVGLEMAEAFMLLREIVR
jgi:LmbE family N-acetylglucosaminyl deacetylase